MADLNNLEQDLRALREVVRELTQRVYRLEQAFEAAAQPSEQARPVAPGAAPQAPEVVKPEPVIAPALSSVETGHAPSLPGATGGYGVASRAGAPAPHYDVDLESRIGSHWLNRIRIAAVLI